MEDEKTKTLDTGENPLSRNEKILLKTLKQYDGELEEPESRIENLLIKVCNLLEESIATSPDWDVDESEKGYIRNKPYIRAGSGENSIIEGDAEDAEGEDSHAEGFFSEAIGDYAHAEGYSIAEGNYSHAEGQSSSYGTASHAEGSSSAKGRYSHSEGYASSAEAEGAHAEGRAVAEGEYSHAEGRETRAKGNCSHAEGYGNEAVGANSHAEGCGNYAFGPESHVFGRYCVLDRLGEFVEIVGGGRSIDIRNNIRALDWQGNEVLAGRLTVGREPENNQDVATKKYVDDLAAELQLKIDALVQKETESSKAKTDDSSETKKETEKTSGT